MDNTHRKLADAAKLPVDASEKSPSARRYFVICFHRGGSRHKQFSQALQDLCRNGVEATVAYCSSSAHARRLARNVDASAYDAVLAAGGDGVVNDVVTGLLQRPDDRSLPFGVLPVGTGNGFAQEIGFRGKSLSTLPARLSTLNAHPIYVGGVSAKDLFTLVAVVGFGPQMIEKVSDRLKKLIGNGAYVVAAILALLTYKSRRYKVEVNGESHQAYTVLIINACRSEGPIPLVKGASLRDPRLHVCLIQQPGKLFVGKLLWNLVLGKLADCDGFHTIDCTSCRISGIDVDNSDEAVMTDGDITGKLPAEFSIQERSLSVLGFPDDPSADAPIPLSQERSSRDKARAAAP